MLTGRALGQSAAEDDVFHLRRVDARTLDRLPQHVRGHGNAMGLVERAAAGLGDPGAAIGDDCHVLHRMSLLQLVR